MDGASRWTSDRIFYCFGGASRDGWMSLGWVGPDGSRPGLACSLQANSILCNNFQSRMQEQSKDDARVPQLSPSKHTFQSSLVTPTPPVVCYSRDRTSPATRINRGPLWRPMFSCSQEGAAAYRGLLDEAWPRNGPPRPAAGRRCDAKDFAFWNMLASLVDGSSVYG